MEDAGCKEICILHCVAVYPPKNETLQLNNILGLRARFPNYPIGYSDHSIGVEMAGAATALGACLIEKHFTLDKYRLGMDNAMAIEPSEMTQLVNSCKNIHGALGSQERVLSKPELEQKIKMRRSVVSTRPIKKGNIISMDDLDAKRPGSGISPVNLKSLIGKTAQRDINGDELILNDDVI